MAFALKLERGTERGEYPRERGERKRENRPNSAIPWRAGDEALIAW